MVYNPLLKKKRRFKPVQKSVHGCVSDTDFIEMYKSLGIKEKKKTWQTRSH